MDVLRREHTLYYQINRRIQITVYLIRHITQIIQSSSQEMEELNKMWTVKLYIICLILSSLYAILVATLIAFLRHRGELAISLYL